MPAFADVSCAEKRPFSKAVLPLLERHAIVWRGFPFRTAGKSEQASSVCRPLEGQRETKKAHPVVALSCVTCFGQGRRFASDYRSAKADATGVPAIAPSSTPGVYPASCPEIRRPARNHRHVRIG
jgi:hypothetical protein